MSNSEVTRPIPAIIVSVEASRRHYGKVKDDKDLLTAFHGAGKALDFIDQALQAVKNYLNLNGLSSSASSLNSCKSKANVSEKIFKLVSGAPKDTRYMCYETAVQETGNGQTVEDLVLGMMKGIRDLANSSGDAGMKHCAAWLNDRIMDLADMGSSLQKKVANNQFNAHDNSTQFNAPGGNQHNNISNGFQFTGTNHGGFHYSPGPSATK